MLITKRDSTPETRPKTNLKGEVATAGRFTSAAATSPYLEMSTLQSKPLIFNVTDKLAQFNV